MSVETVIQKTKEYLEVPSVIGFENPFIQYLISDFKKIPNISCQINPDYISFSTCNFSFEKPIFSAHLDRHGFLSDPQGLLDLASLKRKKELNQGIDETSEAVYNNWKGRLIGTPVVAYNPDSGKVLTKSKISSVPLFDYKTRTLKFSLEDKIKLDPNTPLMYENSFSDNGNFVSGQIDNCISIATVYELFKEGFEGSAIFPIDEECGSSWIRLLRFFDTNKVSSFNSLIVLDTTPYNKDQPKVEKGVVALRTKDEFAPFNPEMVQKMKEELSGSIPLDFKDEIIEIENTKDIAEGKEPRHLHLGKTELGRVISESKGRINGATIQLPTFNYHTNEETTSKIALKNYLAAISTLS